MITSRNTIDMFMKITRLLLKHGLRGVFSWDLCNIDLEISSTERINQFHDVFW